MQFLNNFTIFLKFVLPKSALFLASLTIAISVWLINAAPPAIAATVEEGQAIFQQSCASCHTIDGSSAAFGPDLKGITEKRDRDWLVSWISAPDQTIAKGDAIASELLQKYNNIPMPNMGLQTPQIEAILTYLETQTGKEIASAQTPIALANAPTEPQKGNPQIGKQLFAGTRAFQNRAPACMSCHSVNSVGALKGGTLGPDLTHIFARYGEIGLASVLQTLPFPTMQGIYQNKLLTEEEQTNLLAFFEQANRLETPPIASLQESKDSNILNLLTPTWIFAAIGLSGFLLLVLLSHFIWRDRFQGMRQRLLNSKPE